MLLLLSGLAQAQDTVEFAGTEDAKQKFDNPESEASAELGGTYASGNAVFYTVNGALSGAYRWKRNKLQAQVGANLGNGLVDVDGDGALNGAEREADWSETARRIEGEARYDRFVGDRDSLYLLAGAFHDTFAGYDLRSHEQIGYSRILVENMLDVEGSEEQEVGTLLLVEIGADVAQEDYVEGVEDPYQDIFAARLMLGLTHQLTDSVSFNDKLEVYENIIDFEDLRLLNEASLTTSMSDVLSLKLSHSLIYDNVPVEGFQALDQVAMVTLVASLL